MPFPTAEQFDAILDRQGHEPCPGVDCLPEVEIAPACEGTPRLRAVVWRPAARQAGPGPGLLAFHGGGFTGGTPEGCGGIAKVLAIVAGVTTVAPSYRLGTAQAPSGLGLLADGLTAWRWLQAQAAGLGIDPARIAVSGESAGCVPSGHLAVRSPHVGGLAGLRTPAAWIAQWGPVDFVARWFDNGENAGAEVNLFGPGGLPAHPQRYHQASVLTWAQAPLPPALFVYGRRDRVVHARQGQLGHGAWQTAGAHSEYVVIDNIGHGVIGDNREQRRILLEKLAAFSCRW